MEEFRNRTDPNKPDIHLVQHPAIELVWKSQAGTNYQVVTTTDLDSGAWENAGGVVTGSGTTNTFLDSTRGANRKFYRVIAVP